MRSRAAVFLDRDGVIVEEVGYLAEPSQLVLIPGAGEAIAQLRLHGVPVIVTTNQSGVARGYYPEGRVAEIHRRLDELLALHFARIDRYYYCPHHPTEGLGAYRVACECRKPRPGMLLNAARELGLDLAHSYMVGDKLSDLEAGANAGCRTILVKTGYGAGLAQRVDAAAMRLVCVAADLSEAAQFCLRDSLSSFGAETAPRCSNPNPKIAGA